MIEWGMASGTILYDTYVIKEVLGEGGFGITYRAIRKETGEVFAIKEYFPIPIASRKNDSYKVLVSKQDLGEYIHGKERFMKEASILKEYQYLQGIVKVWDCFEANNTAYIVMGYIEGITLKEYISSHGRMEYKEIVDMLLPVLKALIALHKHDVVHRDISPDNLMIGLDNELYLIDFGAAKEMEYGKTTTVLLKAGYAPPEQYLHDGDMGAWTDVYAMCATIYTTLSGKVPTDAVARLQGKEIVPLSEYDVQLEEWQWDTLVKGMNMRAAERFRNVEQLYDALTIAPSDEDVMTLAEPEVSTFAQEKFQQFSEKAKSHKQQRSKWKVVLMVILVVALVTVYGGKHFLSNENTKQYNKVNDTKTDSTNMQEREMQTNIDNLKAMNKMEQNIGDISSEEQQVRLCSMPDVVGLWEEKATRKITEMDKTIVIRINREYNSNTEKGIVIEQSVKAETQYNEGAIKEIILTISDGPKPTTKILPQKSTEDDYFDIESEEDKSVEFYFD